MAFTCHAAVPVDSDLLPESEVVSKTHSNEYSTVFGYRQQVVEQFGGCCTPLTDDEEERQIKRFVIDSERIVIDSQWRGEIAKHDRSDNIKSKRHTKIKKSSKHVVPVTSANRQFPELSETRFSDPEFSEPYLPDAEYSQTRNLECSQTLVSEPEFSPPRMSEMEYSEMRTSGLHLDKYMSEPEYSEIDILEQEYSVKSEPDVAEPPFHEPGITLLEEFTLIKDSDKCVHIFRPPYVVTE